jgi:flagellar basal-body rod protein FlgB
VPTDVTMQALHSTLRGLATRQRALANDVANIETPGYLGHRVQFEDSLREALASGASPEITPAVRRSLEPTRENGNNVNLDQASLQLIDTGLRYQFGVEALTAKFNLLRTAIKGS